MALTVVRDDIDLPAVDAELARAERDLAQHEQQLAAELSRLDGAAQGIWARMERLRAVSAQPALAAVADPRFAELARRAQLADIPRSSSGEIRLRAMDARRIAVETRARAAAELRQAIQAEGAQLSALHAQVAADEGELARYEHLAAERAARAAAQAQAAQVAARAAPIPVPGLRPAAAPAPKAPIEVPSGRRQTPRVRMQAAVDFGSDTNFFTGFSTNISEGGLFIATVAHVVQGTPVDLSFTLPGGTRISVHGVVRWTREVNDATPDIFPGVGVQFADLSPEAAAAIKQFVVTREPLFYPD